MAEESSLDADPQAKLVQLQGEALARSVGAATLSSEVYAEVIPTAEDPNMQRAGEISEYVKASQQSFLQEALARGMSEEDIAEAARAAVSSGALPRIVSAVSFRDGAGRISIIHGKEVPGSALTVKFSKNSEGVLEGMTIQKSMMASIPPQPAEGDPNGYYQEVFATSPHSSPEEWQRAAISMNAALKRTHRKRHLPLSSVMQKHESIYGACAKVAASFTSAILLQPTCRL